MAAALSSIQDFLGLLPQLQPQGYLDPIKNVGPGYELYTAFAAIAARLATARANAQLQGFIGSATGGVLATGTVQFTRTGTSAMTLNAGTLVSCSDSGVHFVTTAPVVFGADVVGPLDVPIAAVAPGYEANVAGAVLANDGTLLPGDIDTIVFLDEAPPVSDLTFSVTNAAPTTGGLPPVLDQLGLDRGIARQTGETDPRYRLRIQTLPDTVSPGAIQRAIASYFSEFALSGSFIETFSYAYQGAYDDTANPATFCYDDPRPDNPFQDRWLDAIDYRGAFIVVVTNLPTMSDCGMAYDDPAANAAQLQSEIGRRGCPAYDVPSSLIVSELQGGYDGFDLPKQAVYSGLYAMLQSIKAAGVDFAIVLAGS